MQVLERQCEHSLKVCRVVTRARASAHARVQEQGLGLELASATLHVDGTVSLLNKILYTVHFSS